MHISASYQYFPKHLLKPEFVLKMRSQNLEKFPAQPRVEGPVDQAQAVITGLYWVFLATSWEVIKV